MGSAPLKPGDRVEYRDAFTVHCITLDGSIHLVGNNGSHDASESDLELVPDASPGKRLVEIDEDFADVISGTADGARNEATAFPVWFIATNGSFGQIVWHAGPWFSRAPAEAELHFRAYRYPKKAYVYCACGEASQDYKMFVQFARTVARAKAGDA